MNHFTKNLPAQMHKLNKNLKPAMSKMSKLNKNLTKNLTKNISNLKPSMDQLIKQNLRPTKVKYFKSRVYNRKVSIQPNIGLS
jgi:hypothetical protein